MFVMRCLALSVSLLNAVMILRNQIIWVWALFLARQSRKINNYSTFENSFSRCLKALNECSYTKPIWFQHTTGTWGTRSWSSRPLSSPASSDSSSSSSSSQSTVGSSMSGTRNKCSHRPTKPTSKSTKYNPTSYPEDKATPFINQETSTVINVRVRRSESVGVGVWVWKRVREDQQKRESSLRYKQTIYVLRERREFKIDNCVRKYYRYFTSIWLAR